MAQEAWRAYLELAYGMTEATTKKATKTVRQLVGRSGATAEQLQAMAEDLMKAGTNNREAMTKLVRYELDRALGAVGLATAEEVAGLTTRVHELEAQLKAASVAATAAVSAVEPEPALPVGAEVVEPDATATPAVAAAKRTVAKRAVAKKTVAKKTAAPVEPAPAPVQAAPVKRSGPAKKAAAKAALEKIAEASDVAPVKKATPRKRASSS